MSFSGLNPPETSALISIEAPQTVRLWCLTSDGGMLGGRLVGENHARVYWKAWQARCSWTFHDSRPALDIRVVVASQTEETIGGNTLFVLEGNPKNLQCAATTWLQTPDGLITEHDRLPDAFYRNNRRSHHETP